MNKIYFSLETRTPFKLVAFASSSHIVKFHAATLGIKPWNLVMECNPWKLNHKLSCKLTHPNPWNASTPRYRPANITSEGERLSLWCSQCGLSNEAFEDNFVPDVPRFSSSELREVYRERDELRTQLESATDELRQYKPEYVHL